MKLTLSDGNGNIIGGGVTVIVEHGQREHVLPFCESGCVRDRLVKAHNVRVSRAGETTPRVRNDTVIVVRPRTVQDYPCLR